jgi:hypothetical protein
MLASLYGGGGRKGGREGGWENGRREEFIIWRTPKPKITIIII